MIRAILGASLIVLASFGALGQPAATPPAAQPAFEVASIKLNTSGEPGSQMRSGGGGEIIMRNFSLKQIIKMAYEVKDYSLSGPEWLDSERFDINAKPPAGTARDQMRPMLRALLTERFKLAVHREPKTLSAYALVADKNGLKVKEVEAPGAGSGSQMRMGRGQLNAQKMSMAQLADSLAGTLDRPVVDKTEVKGVFDIKLEWTPDESQPMGVPGGPGDGGERRPAADNPSGPSIFTALQEQLGLKLQGQKLPVEIVVIDHVEKVPTEN